MKRRMVMVGPLMALALWATAPSAQAGFGVAGSLGTGFLVKDGNTNRTSVNIEVIPFWKFTILYADLGIIFNFEEPRNFSFRPGVRLDLKLLYLRAAIPLRVNMGGDYGFLFGLGHLFSLGPAGIFLEADMNLSKELGFGVVPIEFRAGVQFAF